MTTLLLSGLAVTAAVCASLTAAVIPLLRRARVIDVPGDRSLHKTPVPRGGGLAIVLSASLATWATVLAAVHRHDTVHSLTGLGLALMGLATVLAFALLGLIEDLFSVSVRARLVLQLVLGAGLGLVAHSAFEVSLWWTPVVCVGTAALVNATNFMDGANGLACSHALMTSLWYVQVASEAARTMASPPPRGTGRRWRDLSTGTSMTRALFRSGITAAVKEAETAAVTASPLRSKVVMKPAPEPVVLEPAISVGAATGQPRR